MKEFYLAELNVNQDFTDFFMLRSLDIRLGGNKKEYLDITISDSSGEMSAKKWDITEEEAEQLKKIPIGEPVKIKGIVTEWNGIKQIKIGKIRQAVKEDKLDVKEFVRTAPEESEDMYEYILGAAQSMKDEQLKQLCTELLEENHEQLLYYPAASKNHHAILGGLLYHMKRMIMSGKALCKIYTNVNEDLAVAGVIIHDMEKIREIESNSLGISPGYTFKGELLGHIVQGIVSIEEKAEKIGLSEEKKVMLQHMILSHHYEPEFGSPKRPMFPEAELLHYLDILDARMYDMEYALETVEPGKMSNKVWTLENRKVYKVKNP